MAALARVWIAAYNSMFIRLYRKCGQAWAAFLHKHPLIKKFIKPIWDAMWQAQLLVEVNYGIQN